MKVTVYYNNELTIEQFECESRMISPSEKMLALQNVSGNGNLTYNTPVDIIFIPMDNILKIECIDSIVQGVKSNLTH